MQRKHTVVYFERAWQEGVHLHVFDSVRMLKPLHNITSILFNFCQALRAQFTCKASQKQEVEYDEPLK